MFGGGRSLEREGERKKKEINLKLPQIKGFGSVFWGWAGMSGKIDI